MSEIEKLRERVREVEKERDEAIAAVDANWVTHQRVVTAEATVASLKEQVEAMRRALIAEREENLWNAYHTGIERDGRWSHAFMSDGEWLARECGFDAAVGDYPADAIKAAIPEAAKRAALTTEKTND